jgi:predicted esterase
MQNRPRASPDYCSSTVLKMTETDLSLSAEIKLYYDLHTPADVATPAPLLIAVHGYGAHKRYMMREAKLVAPDNFVIASLQGPHQHFRQTSDGYKVGFGWLTDFKAEESVALHHKFINDLVGKLVDEGRADPARIYLYGFSQACALNFRYAFTYPGVLRAIIGACGGIPGDLDTNPVYKPFNATAFYLFGDDDEFYSQEKFVGFDEKLRTLLPNYRSSRYAAKHETTDEMRDDIRTFLTDMSL